MLSSLRNSRIAPWATLALLLLFATVLDRVWLGLDQSVPSWDDGYHLSNALTYRDFLNEGVRWFSADWWSEFLRQTTKNPPLSYVLGAWAMMLFGASSDAAAWIFMPMNAVILVSVFLLGRRLWRPSVGLWAAVFVILMPGLRDLRLVFLIDQPLVALVTASFTSLTFWHLAKTARQGWAACVAFGICLGLAMLAKPTSIIYLATPLLVTMKFGLSGQNWRKLGQAMLALVLCAAIAAPWYLTNLIFVFSAGSSAAIDSARIEGDPLPDTLAAWTFYAERLPGQITWPLLAFALTAGTLSLLSKAAQHGTSRLGRFRSAVATEARPGKRHAVIWLAIYLVGSYVLITLIPNKDSRYVTPYLPVVAVLLAAVMAELPRYAQGLQLFTAGLALLAMLNSMFLLPVLSTGPLSAALHSLSPAPAHQPDLKGGWPNRAIMDAVASGAPHQISVLGVLTATDRINDHSLGFFGRLGTQRVYASELGNTPRDQDYEMDALDWFLINVQDQKAGEFRRKQLITAIEQNPDFNIFKQFTLPDGGKLHLYRRTVMSQTIIPDASVGPHDPVSVTKLVVPPTAQSGVPVAATYLVTGGFEALANGLLLVTWSPEFGGTGGWKHDHGIAGGLMQSKATARPATGFQVTDVLAMVPDGPVGRYRASAFLVDRRDGSTIALTLPDTVIDIVTKAPLAKSPPIDLVTRFRGWSVLLRKGPSNLTELFADVGRTNMVARTQDYIAQAKQATKARLVADPDNIELLYEVTVAAVLQRDAATATQTLELITDLAPKDAFAHAYLGFVHLYRFRPNLALTSLREAERRQPGIPEVRLLEIAAEAMRGNLVGSWQLFRELP